MEDSTKGESVIAKHAFKGTNPNELSFKKGQVIQVINRDDSGWAQGILDGAKGWFPISFVIPLQKDDQAKPDEVTSVFIFSFFFSQFDIHFSFSWVFFNFFS